MLFNIAAKVQRKLFVVIARFNIRCRFGKFKATVFERRVNDQGGAPHPRFAVDVNIIFTPAIAVGFGGYRIHGKARFFKNARHLIRS